MADRKRSTDMSRDTEKVLGARGTISQGGRVGGTLARDIASRDERKRAAERPAGATRVTKADESGRKRRSKDRDENQGARERNMGADRRR